MKRTEEELRECARCEFENHEAVLKIDTKDMTVIDWRDKNGRLHYYVHYIIDKKLGNISISGDLGYCISSWYGQMTLEDAVARTRNIGYWMEKFQTTTDDYTYKYEDIEADLNTIRDEYIDNKEDYGIDVLNEEIVSDFDEILEILYDQWEEGNTLPKDAVDIIEKYDSQWYENHNWFNIGKTISYRVYLWSEGLKMAYEQLNLPPVTQDDNVSEDNKTYQVSKEQLSCIYRTLSEARYFAKDIRKYLYEIEKERPLDSVEKEFWERTHDVHVHTNDAGLIIQDATRREIF